jgi:hypothetical protein
MFETRAEAASGPGILASGPHADAHHRSAGNSFYLYVKYLRYQSRNQVSAYSATGRSAFLAATEARSFSIIFEIAWGERVLRATIR